MQSVLHEIRVDAQIVSLLAGYFVHGSKGLDVLRARLTNQSDALEKLETMLGMCSEKIQSRVENIYREDGDLPLRDKLIFDACNKKLKIYWDKVSDTLLNDLDLIDVRDTPVCCSDLWGTETDTHTHR